MTRRLILLATALAAAGCSQTANEIGKEPALTAVGSGLEPTAAAMYEYPQAPEAPVKRFSLWSDSQSRLFTDARALAPGDLVTVLIEIDDRARFKNESERNRTTNRTLGLGAELGWDGFSTGGAADGNIGSTTSTTGAGATARSESLKLSVAAVVTNVLPNGNLIIRGTQEVRVNAELRVLTIAGIVRPADIGAKNTVAYERIAEARISYGGRGRITEVQQPPYGQQILDHVLPF